MRQIPFRMGTYVSKSGALTRIIIILLLVSFCCYSVSEAQIVSHGLRRLAVSTNQFGIDALKALDRIEPPDKVLVFCPVCLSSSLMMIMMGSSKYQVVSSFRHALYVWSMNPHEINRGFKDIFEHIGLNQLQQTPSTQQSSISVASRNGRYNLFDEAMNSQEYRFVSDEEGARGIQSPKRRYSESKIEVGSSSAEEYFSLPKLIKMRESLQKPTKDHGPWWTSAARKSDNDFTKRKLNETLNTNSPHFDENDVSFKYTTAASNHNQTHNEDNTVQDQRDIGDASQMSALCNIYIQRGLNMNYNYNLLLRQYYKTVIHPVDFIRNGEETRQHINSLVAANTEGKIKDLVKRGTFEPATKIMIISTFHFRGTLDVHINSRSDTTSTNQSDRPRSTKKQPKRARRDAKSAKKQLPANHQQSTRNTIFIETEETLLKYGNFKNLDCSVIEIPFNNRLVSLVIVMPNHHNSTELLLTKLSAQVLSDMINSLVVKKLSIEIPVIKFDRGPVNAEGILKELGLDDSFLADKVYTSETGLNRWMRPSDIVHETSIDIGTINPKWSQTMDRLTVAAHENGSDSNIGKRRESANSNHVKLDKPFFYFVLDSINGLVLTMGRIRQ